MLQLTTQEEEVMIINIPPQRSPLLQISEIFSAILILLRYLEETASQLVAKL